MTTDDPDRRLTRPAPRGRRAHPVPAADGDRPAPARRRPGRATTALAVLAVALTAAGCSVGAAAVGPTRVAAAPGDREPGASPGTEPGAPPPDGPADGVDADLLARFEAARAAAAAEDVELRITSGRRTAEEQQRLVDEAVAEYGVPEAYRWVLPPETSAHVQGLAIDVGATQGAYWLAERAVEFGLCQTYANEIWHFEKLPDGATECPEQHPDSSWGWG